MDRSRGVLFLVGKRPRSREKAFLFLLFFGFYNDVFVRVFLPARAGGPPDCPCLPASPCGPPPGKQPRFRRHPPPKKRIFVPKRRYVFFALRPSEKAPRTQCPRFQPNPRPGATDFIDGRRAVPCGRSPHRRFPARNRRIFSDEAEKIIIPCRGPFFWRSPRGSRVWRSKQPKERRAHTAWGRPRPPPTPPFRRIKIRPPHVSKIEAQCSAGPQRVR